MLHTFVSGEIATSTSSCTKNAFNGEELNLLCRKTVRRTNIRPRFISPPLQVLIPRCPVFIFSAINTSAAKATCPGFAGQGAAEPRNLLIRKETPCRAKIFKKRAAASASPRRVSPGRLRVQQNAKRTARSRVPRAASQLRAKAACQRASSEISRKFRKTFQNI